MTAVWLVLIGLVSGVFGGMGMGGGTLLIPMLTLFLGIGQKVSQGVNLIAFLPMSLVAIAIHLKNGFIKTNNLAWLIVPGILFSIGGSFFVSIMPRKIISIIFSVFLLAVAVWQFILFFKDLKSKK